MPLTIDTGMIDALAKLAIQQEQIQKRFAPSSDAPRPNTTTISPAKALVLGGMADAASTYAFLKRGSLVEDNAMLSGLKNRPAPVAATVAGTSLGMLLLTKMLAKKYPKIADTLAGGLGGSQMTIAAGNIEATGGLSDADLLNFHRVNSREDPRMISRLAKLRK